MSWLPRVTSPLGVRKGPGCVLCPDTTMTTSRLDLHTCCNGMVLTLLIRLRYGVLTMLFVNSKSILAIRLATWVSPTETTGNIGVTSTQAWDTQGTTWMMLQF